MAMCDWLRFRSTFYHKVNNDWSSSFKQFQPYDRESTGAIACKDMSASTTSHPDTLALDPNSWRRRNKSTTKLKNFFGHSAQIDVSVLYGLPALLSSNVPLCYFLSFLLESLRAENLFFYLEAVMFEEYTFETNRQLRHSAKELYNNFIREDSIFEVNIEAATKKRIQDAIRDYDQTCFAEARDHILNLLQPCFAEFHMSKTFERMREEIGEDCNVYDPKSRDKAIKVLIEHLDKSYDLEYEAITGKDPNVILKAKHKILIRMLVHTFCRTRLRVDFYDKEGANLPKPDVALLTGNNSSF